DAFDAAKRIRTGDGRPGQAEQDGSQTAPQAGFPQQVAEATDARHVLGTEQVLPVRKVADQTAEVDGATIAPQGKREGPIARLGQYLEFRRPHRTAGDTFAGRSEQDERP